VVSGEWFIGYSGIEVFGIQVTDYSPLAQPGGTEWGGGEVGGMPSVPRSVEELRANLARELEVQEAALTPQARFVGDLGVSSINAIIVVMALEEWFGLAISDDEAENLCTLADVVTYLGGRSIRLPDPV
jgi:acyl carrier protein